MLPGAANITTVAGDACIAIPIGNPASGWRIAAYCRMSQTLIDDVAVRTSSTYANPAWLTSLAWSKLTGVPTTLAGYGITDAPTKTGSGASGSWGIDITGWAKSAGAGADIASAATLDLTGRTGNIVRVTGTVPVTAVTLNNGDQVWCYAVGALPLTYNATTMPIPGGVSYTCTAGDMLIFTKNGNGDLTVEIVRRNGLPVTSGSPIQPIVASVGSNALTVTLNPTALDFRSATLTTGTPVTRTVPTAISLTVSSGSTLGTVNAVQSDLYILAIDNAGTVELAIVNASGGNDLSETGVISTTAEGGAGAADSASVIYSTTARTNVAYRVVGLVRSTQATAGTWATAPSLVQGQGGNALSSMMSLGYGQTEQDVTASRNSGTWYYNTTGKPIFVYIQTGTAVATGATVFLGNPTTNVSYTMNAFTNNPATFSFTVRIGSGYRVDCTNGFGKWLETR